MYFKIEVGKYIFRMFATHILYRINDRLKLIVVCKKIFF